MSVAGDIRQSTSGLKVLRSTVAVDPLGPFYVHLHMSLVMQHDSIDPVTFG